MEPNKEIENERVNCQINGMERCQKHEKSCIAEIEIQSSSFCFSAAHFIAFKGYREKIHGHNYTLGLKLRGLIQDDGYIVDFTFLKNSIKNLCQQLDDHFIVPLKSDVLIIQEVNEHIKISCEEELKKTEEEKKEKKKLQKQIAEFSFPKTDCILMPIKHSSVEEIGHYIMDKIIEEIDINFLKKREVSFIQLSLFESPTRRAIISRTLET